MENCLKQYQMNVQESFSNNASIDNLMKKVSKYKDVKEENKKLRKLLQNQLENTEKVRDETQRTMKILRD